MSVRASMLAAAGIALLAVGSIGIVLPLLPATPFFIAAAAEAGNSGELVATLTRINLMHGVLAASMVFERAQGEVGWGCTSPSGGEPIR